ncbi:hypothetical protein CVS30_06060 [Arthrobacter psychrolactophilus]|uniref:Uncharacterized protein n=1 Tax=Arthrobacter psychrolactophilus TaxID=92442 RepID=A0A2V5ISH3_9MICC|nr:hypothetical protein [Arthrobacter psychrolactophilus]PYI39508.1 hypothetical protein CVS30_06060 [Arthrobacter psychrolactophilus]
MSQIARTVRRLARRRKLVVLVAVVSMLVAAIAIVFGTRPAAPEASPLPRPPGTTVATASAAVSPAVVRPKREPDPALAPNEPKTADYKVLAKAAAEMIYTWDARKSTFSAVYERVRSWWDVLPDGSNPLTVLAQEFQATGVTAASFASLSGMQAYRTAAVASSACDDQLAQVKAQPAPWVGLHVCTFTLKVTEHQAGGDNSYSAPVSVMVNCPPAANAPADRCVMVGFYASPDRIVY